MIREQRTFSKTLFKPGEFEKRRLYVLVWTQNILKKELFETMTSQSSKMTGDFCVFKNSNSSCVGWKESKLMCFQCEIFVFKFFWRRRRHIKYHLITESELITGKSQTKTLVYWPSDSEVNTSRPWSEISCNDRTDGVNKLFIICFLSAILKKNTITTLELIFHIRLRPLWLSSSFIMLKK